MEPEEQIFLNIIDEFTVEEIKYAIAKNMDLAAIAQQEIPDYLDSARGFARTYIRRHPDRTEYLKDPMRAAQKIVQVLKGIKKTAALGYEIELYKSHPTTSSTGFKIKTKAELGGGNNDPLMGGTVVETQNHVGYAWVASNLVSLSELLLK